MDSAMDKDCENLHSIGTPSKQPTPLETLEVETNPLKQRTKSFKNVFYKLNCMNHRLSTSIEETNYNETLYSDDSYNKSTSSEGYYEKRDRGSVSSEVEYEQVQYNSLYDTVGNIKLTSTDTSEKDIYINYSAPCEDVAYEVFVKPPPLPPPLNSQHTAKGVVKPPVPIKPENLCEVRLRQQQLLSDKQNVDIAISYHRLEELSRKSEVTSRDVQETLCIVKELENVFHDKVNQILNKFKDN